jgi:hypothetical protein
MVCRNDPDDPRKCERCGQFLWVSDEGLFCGDCGVTMPCMMRVLPMPPATVTGGPRVPSSGSPQ